MTAKQSIYQVDAFTKGPFSGNPAAVCPLDNWLSDELMQAIAQENNLSETAFIVGAGNRYHIRWFTPNTEVALCGHATLATAFILFDHLGCESDHIVFESLSGELRVRKNSQRLQLDFPALPFKKIEPEKKLLDAINVIPKEIYASTFDRLFIFDDEADVAHAIVDLAAVAKLENRGIILSAPGTATDVYSRCFYPGCDVPEDPVTGSAHCVIAPFWCERLRKKSIHAKQGLARQGELWCDVVDDRVLISGTCELYLEGQIFIPS